MSDVEFHRVPAEEAGELRHELGEVYREVFSEPPYEYGEEHVRLFEDRFEAQRQRPGAGLVIARDPAENMAGFGLTTPPSASWWTDLTTDVEPAVTDGPPGRTFVLVELLVRRPWRGSGVAARLHDLLREDRREERATLTVRPDADAAQHAYASWGWLKVARKRNPLPGSPIHDVLVRDLRPPRTR
ncbi:GNAT family N-acetyltransferase [Actinopolyspora mortivallis]|uniref:GNAT family N-acetyltransferase n=1 Tax=Actinopolyspora mortivallis TaxID=33906 RepID=A0A2T0GUX2_ACTMO|nr:GNAT family N-acetyltransferase [Actinopolyspora mortivallis]PRW62901.1 GNAT family N-acetyltransferase [Actinopolyspora mortivallis]